jgi:hypothetical protein
VLFQYSPGAQSPPFAWSQGKGPRRAHVVVSFDNIHITVSIKPTVHGALLRMGPINDRASVSDRYRATARMGKIRGGYQRSVQPILLPHSLSPHHGVSEVIESIQIPNRNLPGNPGAGLTSLHSAFVTLPRSRFCVAYWLTEESC